MRVLVISDIHSNLAALEAVLAAATPFDLIWCLGDGWAMARSPTMYRPLARVRPSGHRRQS
jgi:predicted phosphodiesterase